MLRLTEIVWTACQGQQHYMGCITFGAAILLDWGCG
jgi:hypothetical protein